MGKELRKGDVVKVSRVNGGITQPPIRGIVMMKIGNGFVDILCEGDGLDYRAHEDYCQPLQNFNIFDMLREKRFL